VAFFFTTRALPGKRPFTTPERCRAVIDALAKQREALGMWVGPYCLMPDHLHFIAATGSSGHSIWELAARFHGASTNALWPHGWIGRVWQRRGYDQLLHNEAAVVAAGEYLFANPVRAGFVEYPEDWQWSGYLDPMDDLSVNHLPNDGRKL
jgi:REP element-mobilizing transposase RayT